MSIEHCNIHFKQLLSSFFSKFRKIEISKFEKRKLISYHFAFAARNIIRNILNLYKFNSKGFINIYYISALCYHILNDHYGNFEHLELVYPLCI